VQDHAGGDLVAAPDGCTTNGHGGNGATCGIHGCRFYAEVFINRFVRVGHRAGRPVGDQFDRVNGHLKRRGRALGIVQLELQIFRNATGEFLVEAIGVLDLPFHELHAGVFLGIIRGSCDLHRGADLCGDIAALVQSGLCRAARNSNGTPQHGSGDAVNGGQLHAVLRHGKDDLFRALFRFGAQTALNYANILAGIFFHLPVMERLILLDRLIGFDRDGLARLYEHRARLAFALSDADRAVLHCDLHI